MLSNWAGLYRYNLNDRVRVTGRLGDSPVLEFLSRGPHTCSITGEKLAEHQVVVSMARAGRALGGNVETFVVQGRFARQPYYELGLEPVAGLEAGVLERDRLVVETAAEMRCPMVVTLAGGYRAAAWRSTAS